MKMFCSCNFPSKKEEILALINNMKIYKNDNDNNKIKALKALEAWASQGITRWLLLKEANVRAVASLYTYDSF